MPAAFQGLNGIDMDLSSLGFGLFGPEDLFEGTDLQGSENPNGLQAGITSACDDISILIVN